MSTNPPPPPPPEEPLPPGAAEVVSAEAAAIAAERPWWQRKRYVIPLGLLVLLIVIAALIPSGDDEDGGAAGATTTTAGAVADEADEATEVADEAAGGATAIPLWQFLTDLDREGMELWSETVCELRTNWGSDVESYETNLLALTTGSNPNFQVIRDYTSSDDEIVALADDLILVRCPEVVTG